MNLDIHLRTCLLVLTCLLIAGCSSQPPTRHPAASTLAKGEFNIAGAYIGQDYWELRHLFPSMQCESSCVDHTVVYLDHPGTLRIGIGAGRVNQLGFVFGARPDGVRRDLLLKQMSRLYGKPVMGRVLGSDCSTWPKSGGAVALCPLSTGAVAHWNDRNWMMKTSVIPSAKPGYPRPPN